MQAQITGTVTNRTTNKPSAGDDVILLKLAQGMQEVARTKTDARGHFTLQPPDPSATYLIRVNHRNVNYHQPLPPGTTNVSVDVYDSSDNLLEVSQTLDIMRIEADSNLLRVIEMLSVNNASSPPRTQIGGKNFEVVLPEGAEIQQSIAAGPNGMPVTSAPVPTGEKGHYFFTFPLRPGETRFQLSYTLPYNGAAAFTPHVTRATDNFAVSVPKSMQLTPASGSKLQSRGEDAGMNVFVAENVQPTDSLAFHVSGTGSVPVDANQQGGQGAGQDNGGAESAAPANRPGGGMAAPINTPDPLYKYRWWLIALVAIFLVAGAAYTMSRPDAGSAADRAVVSGRGNRIAQRDASSVAISRAIASPGEDILLVIKDELFAVESERAKGTISTEEYASVKSALDLLLRRHLNRGKKEAAGG